MRAALIASAALLAAGAYVLWRQSQDSQAEADTLEQAGDWLGDAWQETAELLDTATMGIFRLSNMRTVTGADLAHPNVRAFLAVIRRGEGTSDGNGYRRIFGGELFTSYADHPRKAVTRTFKNGQTVTSTAAGAYQFLASTWDETARIMGLADFSPANQDRGAVGRLAARGALEDIKAGRFAEAIQKTAKEWASLPGSPYGQPVISMTTAQAVYAEAGGVFA